MMAEGVDAEAEMEGLFAGDDMSQEQGDVTQSLTQEEAEQREEGGANLDVTGAAGVKKRVIRNPQPKLNADRLMGPRGIKSLEGSFADWQSKGKGREFEDLDVIMKKMEHWAHRLFPKLPVDGVYQVIANREGKKKVMQTHVKKIRLGMVTDQPVEILGKVDEPEEVGEREVERYGEAEDQPDVFETLLRQAGAKSTTAPPPVIGSLTEDQKEKMRRNKEMAEQRKREKREREQREEEERLRREVEDSALDEEEELERELHNEPERELHNEPMMCASAATEWGDVGNVSGDKSEVEKIVSTETSEKVTEEAVGVEKIVRSESSEKVTEEAGEELMNLDEMMEEMEQ